MTDHPTRAEVNARVDARLAARGIEVETPAKDCKCGHEAAEHHSGPFVFYGYNLPCWAGCSCQNFEAQS